MRETKRVVVTVALGLSLALSSFTACGPSTPRKLKVQLNKAATALNTAAKTNHALFQAGEISKEARMKIAAAIYDANEVLIVAIETAQGINASNFDGSKARILELLQEALTKLGGVSVGYPKIDLAIQSVAAIIGDVLIFVRTINHAQLRGLNLQHELSAAAFVENRKADLWAY